MKKVIIFFALLVIVSCQNSSKSTIPNQDNRKIILGRSFSNEDVLSIDVVEIEHPLLGGIVGETKLTNNEKESFLNDFDKLKAVGPLKCGSKYVIRLIFASDTLKLQVCGSLVSERFTDYYYELPKGENIISKYGFK